MGDKTHGNNKKRHGVLRFKASIQQREHCTTSTKWNSQRPTINGQSTSTKQTNTAMSVQVTYKEEPTQSIRRGPWSPEEDRKLLDAIQLYGPSNWVRISQSLGSRTPKQCRERYHQNLKPSLNRNPITAEEGQLIVELVGKYGKRWAEIARHLNGRSDNAIKNWWNGGANRRRRASSHAVLQEMRDVQPPAYSFYQPSFNTGMFEGHGKGLPQQTQQGLHAQQLQQGPPFQQVPYQQQPHPHQMLPPLSRSESISQEVLFSQPGVKRLLDEHPPARRHSAQTILSTTSSPYSRAGSSRNSSVSEHAALSTTASRRSSLAHEFFPNHMGKRQGSYSSTSYLSSPSLQSSHGGPLPGIVPLTPMSQAQHQQPQNPVHRQQLPHQPPETVFKKGFSFNNEKLPPPSSITETPNFTQLPRSQEKAEPEDKNVMNISNLLV